MIPILVVLNKSILDVPRTLLYYLPFPSLARARPASQHDKASYTRLAALPGSKLSAPPILSMNFLSFVGIPTETN